MDFYLRFLLGFFFLQCLKNSTILQCTLPALGPLPKIWIKHFFFGKDAFFSVFSVIFGLYFPNLFPQLTSPKAPRRHPSTGSIRNLKRSPDRAIIRHLLSEKASKKRRESRLISGPILGQSPLARLFGGGRTGGRKPVEMLEGGI